MKFEFKEKNILSHGFCYLLKNICFVTVFVNDIS